MVWKDYEKIDEMVLENGHDERQERAPAVAVMVSDDVLLLRPLGENK